eukprot:1489258-Prymnesium_polylepis.1
MNWRVQRGRHAGCHDALHLRSVCLFLSFSFGPGAAEARELTCAYDSHSDIRDRTHKTRAPVFGRSVTVLLCSKECKMAESLYRKITNPGFRGHAAPF